MKKISDITPFFVDAIPENIERGTLYISIEFATSVHKCCCGCDMEVVTPFTPTDWQLIFDGVSVSLRPSIGNWSFPCRSHYWITNNEVQWAGDMSQEQIGAGRQRDRAVKGRKYGNVKPQATPAQVATQPSLWSRLRSWLSL